MSGRAGCGLLIAAAIAIALAAALIVGVRRGRGQPERTSITFPNQPQTANPR